jgi:hypothetical protein
MSYYDLLGVPPEATQEEIRAAYRTLVQLFHPDRLAHLKPESRLFAEERLKSLNRAYEVLGDPARRAAYDYANTPRPAPPPQPRASSAPYRPEQRSEPPPPPPPQQPDFPGAARRATLERKRRVAQIEAEIAELSRGVAQMEAERDHTNRLWQRHERRTQRWFWFFTVFTGLGALNLLAIGIGIFAQPPGVLNPLGQRVAFVLLVALYEYAAALTITFVCRTPGAPVSYVGTLLVTGRGLVPGWLVGLLGWGLWQVLFQDINSLASVIVLAVVMLLAHIVFAYFALGHMPRVAREQQRLFEHASKPMLQAYQHQLTQLRAQKAVMESGKWEAGGGK